MCYNSLGGTGFRRGHLLLPLTAAILTGINHSIRRYVLIMANEPLFFSALMGTVSLGASLDQFRTGRHRRAHRRQLSGLVAHSGANFPARRRIH
jgi:hypothetical protein